MRAVSPLVRGMIRDVIVEEVLRADENIMLEGIRYWYVHASSLGRWKERMRPMFPL